MRHYLHAGLVVVLLAPTPLSGGVSMRSLMPGWTSAAWRFLEWTLGGKGAMFAEIILTHL